MSYIHPAQAIIPFGQSKVSTESSKIKRIFIVGQSGHGKSTSAFKDPPGTRRAGVGPELMHYTTGRNLTQFDTDPTSTNPAYYHVSTLNNIAQGDAGDGRKGNKIQLKRITLRMKVEVDPNSDRKSVV